MTCRRRHARPRSIPARRRPCRGNAPGFPASLDPSPRTLSRTRAVNLPKRARPPAVQRESDRASTCDRADLHQQPIRTGLSPSPTGHGGPATSTTTQAATSADTQSKAKYRPPRAPSQPASRKHADHNCSPTPSPSSSAHRRTPTTPQPSTSSTATDTHSYTTRDSSSPTAQES